MGLLITGKIAFAGKIALIKKWLWGGTNALWGSSNKKWGK